MTLFARSALQIPEVRGSNNVKNGTSGERGPFPRALPERMPGTRRRDVEDNVMAGCQAPPVNELSSRLGGARFGIPNSEFFLYGRRVLAELRCGLVGRPAESGQEGTDTGERRAVRHGRLFDQACGRK